MPVHDEIILNTSLMNRILSLDAVAGTVTCQAGCVLAALDSMAREHGYIMPLDLGAKGSCQIGGNLATNAGGVRVLRYGSLRGSVLGLEAVLADGSIVGRLPALRKDNTGIDTSQLFIGSEGALGVITAATILLPVAPAAVHVMFLACTSFEDVLRVLAAARSRLGEVLSAFEFLDAASMQAAHENLGHRSPLGTAAPFYALVETHGSSEVHDRAKIDALLAHLLDSSLVTDGTVAQDARQAAAIWELRESLGVALRKDGIVYKFGSSRVLMRLTRPRYDLSLPHSHFYRIVEETRQRVAGKAVRCAAWGHIGDGNVHLNVSVPQHDPRVAALLEPFVYEFAAAVGGSISAEHGLGQLKMGLIGLSKTAPTVAMMRRLKQSLDPHGILNPGKVLP